MIKISGKVIIETMKHVKRESFVKDNCKILGNKKKKKRRDMIALTDSPTTLNLRGMMTINHKGKRDKGKAGTDPSNPNFKEKYPPEGSKNGGPLNCI